MTRLAHPPKTKETGFGWSYKYDGLLNAELPSMQDARVSRLYDVPLGGTLGDVGHVCLSRFVDSRFLPFGAGIIEEVSLTRHRRIPSSVHPHSY